MSNCFIISNRIIFFDRLSQKIASETYLDPVCITLAPEQDGEYAAEPANYGDPILLYQVFERHLSDCTAEELRKTVVLVDELVAPDCLNPLITTPGPQQFYSMLMLGFPELHFVYLNTHTPKFPMQMALLSWLDEIRRTNRGFQEYQLFDPHSIRNSIRKKINEPEIKKDEGQKLNLPLRNKCALSLDEEKAYALFNAYSAYKAGYICKIIDCRANLEVIKNESPENYDLQFEDLYLNFYDREAGDKNFSNLKTRDYRFKVLGKANNKNRFIVTSGHTDLKRNEGNISGVIIKPAKGIYDLLKQAKPDESYAQKNKSLGKDLKQGESHSNHQKAITAETSEKDLKPGKSHSQKSELSKFKEWRDVWLNNSHAPKASVRREKGGNHSAKGRLLYLAERLLIRAERILQNATDVADAIHASTLALEAKELLSCHTPTTALRALSIQHRAEITAESLFYGIEHSIELKDRFEDIKAEIDAISGWFAKDKRIKQRKNAYLNIVEQLAHVFKNQNQFDEELQCLHEARGTLFEIERLKWRLGIFLKPANWYIQFCLRSTKNFLIAILGCILLFTGIYYISSLFCIQELLTNCISCSLCAESESLGVYDAFRLTFSNFFDVGSLEGYDSLRANEFYIFVAASQYFVAISNITLLFSYIFLKLSRR